MQRNSCDYIRYTMDHQLHQPSSSIDNVTGDRNETPQSIATTLGGGTSEDQSASKKTPPDDQAIEAIIARYAGAGDTMIGERQNAMGHAGTRLNPSLNGASDPQGSGRESEDWRGRVLMEQAAIASIAHLSQRLLNSETCLHETINARYSFKFLSLLKHAMHLKKSMHAEKFGRSRPNHYRRILKRCRSGRGAKSATSAPS